MSRSVLRKGQLVSPPSRPPQHQLSTSLHLSTKRLQGSSNADPRVPPAVNKHQGKHIVYTSDEFSSRLRLAQGKGGMVRRF
ncbi:hypothetical protein EVAR_2797_1 [Eumeta japonica]|uniref:Uncharacterized protein n=1 Tax=Eumeta variegata TaxID=151549 RepID=A0A4C1T0K0_EUMVA|nr:hypothetical protein EVAR_2797_1 [Eumeta japonica]